ncbi:hypothetical protein [Schleiferilactobacillus shenzhenensis]|uniref:Uncharacterized protein n=1 Tax=Schleiferilactobacillus shenzhenensis LY-73 TaxID=1231336 RepID=U4TIR9_9LACO|nr:hypothetical protein [Schleiferilactobacillus shenzhenensis]ERL64094.1 hypothetical protein L248_1627 [Schleiferilactobacillus shenzhenensis LY-73]
MKQYDTVVFKDITVTYDTRITPLITPTGDELLFVTADRTDVVVFFRVAPDGKITAAPRYGGNIKFRDMHHFTVDVNFDSILDHPSTQPPRYADIVFKDVLVHYDVRTTPFIRGDGNELLFATRLRDDVNAFIRFEDNGDLLTFPNYGVQFVYINDHELTVALRLDEVADD